jgi:hypothetical protein
MQVLKIDHLLAVLVFEHVGYLIREVLKIGIGC